MSTYNIVYSPSCLVLIGEYFEQADDESGGLLWGSQTSYLICFVTKGLYKNTQGYAHHIKPLCRARFKASTQLRLPKISTTPRCLTYPRKPIYHGHVHIQLIIWVAEACRLRWRPGELAATMFLFPGYSRVATLLLLGIGYDTRGCLSQGYLDTSMVRETYRRRA